MRRLLLALAALAFAVPSQAQTAHFAIAYDVASATPTYCVMAGARGNPWGEPIRVNIPIETSGSSATVTAVTALSAPFASIGIGDYIYVRRPDNVTETRTVLTNADDDTITVDSAVNWSNGFVFEFLNLVCGTTEADGWINVTRFDTIQMTVEYETGDLDTLDVTWQCKEGSIVSGPVQVYPGPSSECGFGTLSTDVCSFSTPGTDALSREIATSLFSACRMSLAFGSTDGGTREDVDAILTGRFSRP